MACAVSVSGVAVRPISAGGHHWGRLDALPASFSLSAAPSLGAEALAVEPESPYTEGSAQGPYGQADSDNDVWDLAFLEEQLRESSRLGNTAAKGFTSCSVSFSDGYATSPVVEVKGEGAGQDTATAVFVDESARFWLHGVKSGVQIPSSFRFGTEEPNGDYADIHPPKGSGEHTYTVVLYGGTLDSGPLLSSLRKTPWHNRKRAVGSLEAIESDFVRRNAGKSVEELCRCSVVVSHEDIAKQE
ncbi:uncharacterized protein EMH_0044240 [Eimeria mitis]|uniref:Phosphatidylethanolamine-binding protein n=1 Tax=Eimeria mitis TaxID=44415 RepID=U6K3V7_9EIME|nr:uncharacterized protein EMH_0044240 [Eimeria mitis]CDJ32405.1 hypothetical protein, conserved [Eimeria mitis]